MSCAANAAASAVRGGISLVVVTALVLVSPPPISCAAMSIWSLTLAYTMTALGPIALIMTLGDFFFQTSCSGAARASALLAVRLYCLSRNGPALYGGSPP